MAIIVQYLPNFIYKIIFGHKTIKNTIELDSAKLETEVKTKTVYVQTDELRDINHLEDFNSVLNEVVEYYVNKNMGNDLITAENDNNDNVEEKHLRTSVVDNEKVRFNSRITVINVQPSTVVSKDYILSISVCTKFRVSIS